MVSGNLDLAVAAVALVAAFAAVAVGASSFLDPLPVPDWSRALLFSCSRRSMESSSLSPLSPLSSLFSLLSLSLSLSSLSPDRGGMGGRCVVVIRYIRHTQPRRKRRRRVFSRAIEMWSLRLRLLLRTFWMLLPQVRVLTASYVLWTFSPICPSLRVFLLLGEFANCENCAVSRLFKGRINSAKIKGELIRKLKKKIREFRE